MAQILTDKEREKFIAELLSIEACADLIKQRSSILRKKLAEDSSPASSRKGKVSRLSPAQKENALIKRRKTILS